MERLIPNRPKPTERKSRREKVLQLSEAERDRLMPLARKLRADRRREALEMVVDAALVYRDEIVRNDPAHRGRLRMREEELCTAIEQAVEPIKTGPVTDDDLLIASAVEDSQEKAGS